jgi:hypothetical protein
MRILRYNVCLILRLRMKLVLCMLLLVLVDEIFVLLGVMNVCDFIGFGVILGIRGWIGRRVLCETLWQV